MAIVTAAHSTAVDAGCEILERGGNAVEAAVAVSTTLGVVEPFASGLGGGGFLMVCPGGNPDRLSILDGRSVTSELASSERFYPGGVAAVAMPRTGPMAAGIPGLGRLLARALDEFGGSLELGEVLAPAIRAAENGFTPGRFYQYAVAFNEWVLRGNAEACRTYLQPRIVQKDLARTLSRIAREGFDAIYTGEIGLAILNAVNATGAVWSADDLPRYEVKRREPLRGTYRGHAIYTMPPPSRGGRGILACLERLAEPSDALHLAGVFRDVFERLDAEVGDPDHGTTHMTILDAQGTIVCMTQTLNHFFGSGLLVPGAGILLGDDLAEMSKSPDHPNAVMPRRRPVTNMAPTMVFRDGAPVMALGSPGFHRIVSAQVQTLVNLLARGMTPADAIAAPRVHFEQGKIYTEGFPLKAPGVVQRPSRDPYFGGVHAIHFGPNGPIGLADPRREGVARSV